MYFKQLIIVITALFVASCNNNSKESTVINESESSAHKVEVLKVGNNSFDKELSYSGYVEPKLTVPLSFLLPGTVVSVSVDEGDKVSKGQVLAQLNSTSAINAYQASSAALSQAEDAHRRLKSVYDKGSLPEIQMQDAISKLAQAKSANKIAYQNLSNCTLKSPKSGFIGTRNIEVGSSAIPGNPVLNLVSLNEVYVRVSVPENEINKINKNQKSRIVIPALGSKEFIGKIEKVGVVANRLSKTYEAKILIQNPDLLIKSGMACDVDISLVPSEGKLTIPYRAVIKDVNDKNYVFKVNSESKTASKQLVELGAFANNQIEIVSGLLKGDIIVTEGHHYLLENDKVNF